MNADQIKVKLIDHLLKQDNNRAVASEVPFYQGHRRADILQLTDHKTISYEIKSDLDTLVSVEDQLKDYANTFSYCYVVVTTKHLLNVRKKIGSKVGIILVNDGKLKTIRKPQENKRLSKHSLTLSLSAHKIRQLHIERIKNYSIQDQRMYIENYFNLKSLKKCFYDILLEKYFFKYTNFLKDRGEATTLTDLYYLQSSY